MSAASTGASEAKSRASSTSWGSVMNAAPRPRSGPRRRGRAAGSRTLTECRSMVISPKSSACRARAWPSRTISSSARSVTTHSARIFSWPATDENRMDHVFRKRSRISPIRSSTESGFGSTSRGRCRFCSSMRRCSARWSRCTERSASGTSSGGGNSLDSRPNSRACSASRSPSQAPNALTRAYSRRRSASSWRRSSPSSSRASAGSSGLAGSRSFDLR